jgi:hypothetical protein
MTNTYLNLPDHFKAWITDISYKDDRRHKECYYLTIKTEYYGSFTQKYTYLHTTELIRRMQEAGLRYTTDLLNTLYDWEKVCFGIGFPRYFPILNKQMDVIKNDT